MDLEKFRLEQEAKRAKEKANQQRVCESQILNKRIQADKAEALRLKAEKERLNAELNLSQVKHLIQLLLRRRTLMAGQYNDMHIRLAANTSAINRLIDDLATLLNVTDPSEVMDNDPDNEDVF